MGSPDLMTAALRLTASWPVPHVSAAVVTLAAGGAPTISTIGDAQRSYRLASIAKPITAWAVLVAVEEGLLALDTPLGQPGCTLEHLLAHAGGYPFSGPTPIAPPGRQRIYSNTGIELAAEAVADAAAMPFADYLAEAVLAPLGMHHTDLRGSPAHAMWSTTDDVVRFAIELMRPTVISVETAERATHAVFPQLAGIVPGIGRFEHCTWGLGVEVKGDKSPHWTGATNSPGTFGHFGGAGTFLWVDSGVVHDQVVACLALTDRDFDEWAPDALTLWPALSDAVIAGARG